MDRPTPHDGRGDERHGDGAPQASGGCRVQSVTCGRCGWPSACVTQEGLRVLQYLCHWCGKVTVGVVDPTIKRTIIF